MRLWTLHPQYLDPAGLVALWREGLLAQKVLSGATVGYRQHPQLHRFRAASDPMAAIAEYLRVVCAEADRRGYRFDRGKIGADPSMSPIEATDGQLRFEWQHLLAKVRRRNPVYSSKLEGVDAPETHPLFHLVAGPIADWERAER